jgi:hypothetical protein
MSLQKGCDKCWSFLFEDKSCDCPDVRWYQLDFQIPRWQIYLAYHEKRKKQAQERGLTEQVEILDRIVRDIQRRIERTRENYL